MKSMREFSRYAFVAISAVSFGSAPVVAQTDSLRLSALHVEAARNDPRTKQLELQSAQTSLRLRNISADWYPSFSLTGKAQYQSDVPSLGLKSATGQPLSPDVPHDTYDSYFDVQQRLFDPSSRPRASVERAQLVESQARVQTALFSLRQEVNEAFFTAALLQERSGDVRAAITNLEARLKESEARVAEGVALQGDVAMIKATILQRRQDLLALQASRRAAVSVLVELTGVAIDESTPIAIPQAAASVAQVRSATATVRARPEYAQFSSARELLTQQSAAISAKDKPSLAAYGRAGYGRPGLNFLNAKFDSYWLAGLQVQWAPWTWGSTRREREVLLVQQQIIAADEGAFSRGIQRAVQRDLATVDQMDSTLALDNEIVALYELVEKESGHRFTEGVITTADYLDRSTAVLRARLARTAHKVELAQAQARLLTTLGLEVR